MDHFELRPPSRLLRPLRLPPAAAFFVPICDACWTGVSRPQRLTLRPLRRYSQFRRPSAAPGAPLCRVCRLAPPSFVRAVACGPYEGRMRDAIHALKYDRLHAGRAQLGPMLADAIGQSRPEAPAEMLVIPVPLCTAQNMRNADLTRPGCSPTHALAALRRRHPAWRLITRAEHAAPVARHGKPGQV